MVVFLVALSEYNLNLREDPTINRMHESLVLLSHLCLSKRLEKIPIILFCTKEDIFHQKIQHCHLCWFFLEFSGANEFLEAWDFIIQKFMAVCHKREGMVRVLVGNLTDCSFMGDVVSFIKRNALQSYVNNNKFT